MAKAFPQLVGAGDATPGLRCPGCATHNKETGVLGGLRSLPNHSPQLTPRQACPVPPPPPQCRKWHLGDLKRNSEQCRIHFHSRGAPWWVPQPRSYSRGHVTGSQPALPPAQSRKGFLNQTHRRVTRNKTVAKSQGGQVQKQQQKCRFGKLPVKTYLPENFLSSFPLGQRQELRFRDEDVKPQIS